MSVYWRVRRNWWGYAGSGFQNLISSWTLDGIGCLSWSKPNGTLLFTPQQNRWQIDMNPPQSLDWFCWENRLTGNPWVFTIKLVGLSCKFSHHPILWPKIPNKNFHQQKQRPKAQPGDDIYESSNKHEAKARPGPSQRLVIATMATVQNPVSSL